MSKVKHFRSAASGRRSPKRFGFTLIELIVTVGTIATLIGLVVPNLDKVRTAADDDQNMQADSAVIGLGDEASP